MGYSKTVDRFVLSSGHLLHQISRSMTPLLRPCFAFLLLATLGRAEAPFSWETTPGRLPKNIVPLRYTVRIEPEIEKARFHGSESITLDVRQPVRQIVL